MTLAKEVPKVLTADRRYTGLRRKGVQYEAKVQLELSRRYGVRYLPSPWFRYLDTRLQRIKFCQPDGLIFAPDLRKIVIVEVKLKHTARSWWQLKQQYAPVVSAVFPGIPLAFCTVVKWFDLTIPYPEETVLRPEPEDARGELVQVTIWKP